MSITVQELSKSFENKRGAKERTVVLSDIDVYKRQPISFTSTASVTP